jgi:sugar lactone lactonase YvrE
VRTRFAADLRTPRDKIVVDRCQGQRLDSPNDVVVKSDGSIWFTDPPNGIVSDREKLKAKSELGDCFMFVTMADLIAIPSLIFTFGTAWQIISGRTTGVVKR